MTELIDAFIEIHGLCTFPADVSTWYDGLALSIAVALEDLVPASSSEGL